MLPAAVVEKTLWRPCSELLQPGDIVIDGGNSHYVDDIHRREGIEQARPSTTWTPASAAECGARSADTA